MATLIDSSVLIDAEQGTLDLNGFLGSHPDEDFAISAVTASELLHGVLRARTAQQRDRRTRFVEAVLNGYPVVPFDFSVARTHAGLWAELSRRGAMIGERDLMIAATAIAYGFDLATRDLRSFPRILGLKIIRP